LALEPRSASNPATRRCEYALLAEELGFRAVWCPEIPAFGHDIWVTLARIAEKTKRIKFGPSVLIPSYRHPMAQASAIATLEQIAPGRLMVGFGTGFTGRAGMGKKPLSLASMRTHIAQVRALLHGDVADIDGGLAQILAVKPIIAEKLPNVPGKSLTAVLVSYPPGGKSARHHHAGIVFVYVLSGAVRSENSATGPAKICKAGESFFEPPGSEHLISENASATELASLLAVFIPMPKPRRAIKTRSIRTPSPTGSHHRRSRSSLGTRE
jgi:quercetin dioxygenase-like cupin family protein